MVDVPALKRSLKHWNNRTLISRYQSKNWNSESKTYMKKEIDTRLTNGTLKRKAK